MNTLVWIAQCLMAAMLAAVGMLKLVRTRAQLAPMFAWVEQFSDSAVKWIGVVELLAAVGLVVPALVNVAPVLVPVAALGGVALVIAGSAVHFRRAEYPAVGVNIVFLVLLSFIAWARLGRYRF